MGDLEEKKKETVKQPKTIRTVFIRYLDLLGILFRISDTALS